MKTKVFHISKHQRTIIIIYSPYSLNKYFNIQIPVLHLQRIHSKTCPRISNRTFFSHIISIYNRKIMQAFVHRIFRLSLIMMTVSIKNSARRKEIQKKEKKKKSDKNYKRELGKENE